MAIKQEPVEQIKRKREGREPGKEKKRARKQETSDQQSETTEPKDRRSKKDKSRKKKDKSQHKRDKSSGHAPGGGHGTSEVLQTSDGANSTPAPGVDPPLRTTTPVIPPPVLETVPPLLPAPSPSTLVPDIAQDRDVPNESIGTVNPANLQKQDQDEMSPGFLLIGDHENENENQLADDESGGIGNSYPRKSH